MRIILVYNYYRNRGGEDEVFDAEASLLESRGHEVIRYSKHNDQVAGMNLVHLGAATLWNHNAYDDLRKLIRSRRAEVVHFHNTFPLISPAAYYAAKREGAGVVQTLHNFRMVCPNALLYRDSGVCEECVGRVLAWPGVFHGCYQGSRTASAGVAAMLSLHRILMTWRKQVDVYIALTEFARAKFIEGGLPAEKIVVKPNFLFPDPGVGAVDPANRYALFVGRLSANKGVNVLLDAWKRLSSVLPLKVVGRGPMNAEVADALASMPNAELMIERIPKEELYRLLRGAFAVISPSTCYEGMPMTIIEAYGAGVPVIASRLGGMAAMVEHGRNGLLFDPGSATDLVSKVQWALDHPSEWSAMREAARIEFESSYTADANYRRLMDVYARSTGAMGAMSPENANGKNGHHRHQSQ